MKDLDESGKRGWVWFSSQSTIEKEVFSLTAFIETIAAVSMYWWLAIEISTYWFLIIGAVAALLLLLRSDESTALGVRLFTTKSIAMLEGQKASWRVNATELKQSLLVTVATATALAFLLPDLLPAVHVTLFQWSPNIAPSLIGLGLFMLGLVLFGFETFGMLLSISVLALIFGVAIAVAGCSFNTAKKPSSTNAELKDGDTFGKIDRLPGGTAVATNVITLLNMSCTNGQVIVTTNLKVIVGKMDCDQQIPQASLQHFYGQSISIAYAKGRLRIDSVSAGTIDLPVKDATVANNASNATP